MWHKLECLNICSSFFLAFHIFNIIIEIWLLSFILFCFFLILFLSLFLGFLLTDFISFSRARFASLLHILSLLELYRDTLKSDIVVLIDESDLCKEQLADKFFFTALEFLPIEGDGTSGGVKSEEGRDLLIW